MKVVHMRHGYTENEENVESKTLKGGMAEFDLTATKRIFELCEQYSNDFLETGLDQKEGYFWIIRNTGDNCIKVYQKKGTLFAHFPKFNWDGEIVNLDSLEFLGIKEK